MTASIVSLRAVTTADGSDRQREPAGETGPAAEQRAHAATSAPRPSATPPSAVGQQQAPPSEAEEPRRGDLQPQVDRRLVDRDARGRARTRPLRNACHDVAHGAHGRVVVRVGRGRGRAPTSRSAAASARTAALGARETAPERGALTLDAPGERSGGPPTAGGSVTRPAGAADRRALAQLGTSARSSRNARATTRGFAPDDRPAIRGRWCDAELGDRARPRRTARATSSVLTIAPSAVSGSACTRSRRMSLNAQSTSRTVDVEDAAHERRSTPRRSGSAVRRVGPRACGSRRRGRTTAPGARSASARAGRTAGRRR